MSSFGSPPAGPPPSGPPPSGPKTRRSPLPWIVAVVVLVVVLAVGGAVLALTGGDAGSVQDVADQAVEAAEDLDLDAGVDLLCRAPSGEQREEIEDLIAAGQQEADTDDPEVDYDVSEVDGDTEGTFLVRISGDEPSLDGRETEIRVVVSYIDGRSCIDGVQDPDDESEGDDVG